MNCKPGDLAVVVRCRNCPENIGAVRRIVGDAGAWFPAWVVEPPLPSGDECCCDTCLRPLRDAPGEDEVLQRVGKPEPSTFIDAMRQALGELCNP